MSLLSFVMPPWLSVPLALLKRVPWQAWAVLGLCAAVLFYGHLRFNAGQADTQRAFDAYKASVIAATEKAKVAAQRAESAQAGAIAAATDKLNQDNAHARSDIARLSADLAAGRVRLRDHFKCPARVPGTAASSQGSDAAGQGGLSDEDAGFLVRFAGSADDTARQLTACQAILQSERTPIH